jgi:hypothetical protein
MESPDDVMRAGAPAVSTSVPGQANSSQAGQGAEVQAIVSNRRGQKRQWGAAADDVNAEILRELKCQRKENRKCDKAMMQILAEIWEFNRPPSQTYQVLKTAAECLLPIAFNSLF